jgi:hypothetical protein
MTQMKVIEVNGRFAAEREEQACDCGCGCGMGVTLETSTEAREDAQPVAAGKGLYGRLLGDPYGPCGTRRFS